MPLPVCIRNVLLGGLILCSNGALSGEAPPTPSSSAEALPLEEINALADIFERTKRAYVHPVDDAVLLEGAMKGMVQQLDPHSAYLDPKALRQLNETTAGEFSGVGLEVGMEKGQPIVITPIDDSPAAHAGLKSRDILLEVDGKTLENMPLEAIVMLMRGEAGTPIRLRIQSPDGSAPRMITLKRAKILDTSLTAKRIGAMAYLRISQFQRHTGQKLRQALGRLQQSAPLSGIVLDLRNNPGGILQSAVDVSSIFIDEGLVVSTRGRLKESNVEYPSTHNALIPTLPMVVLINGGSASAAEIVAGALQDHHRAVIMGSTSFGKGSVQSVLPLENGGGLKLTTALYYTPSGRSIQAEGIRPDITVTAARLDRSAPPEMLLKEADLQGHFINTQSHPMADDSETALTADYQLQEALQLLTGLLITTQQRTTSLSH